MRELTACLALVGGAGMNEDARREWLIAARETLQGIPGDLLERGCRHARMVADHPSKIVPAIMREVREAWDQRRRSYAESTRSEPMLPKPEPNEVCTPEAAAAIMAEMGLSTEAKETVRRHLGPPRNPTREDYIALGVDPAVLDEPGQ